MSNVKAAAIGSLVTVAAFVALGMQQKTSVQRVPLLTPEQEEILGHLSIVQLGEG